MVLSLEAYGADMDLGTRLFLERGTSTLMAAAKPLFDKCGLHYRRKT